MQKDLFGSQSATLLPGQIAPKTSFLEKHRLALRLDQLLVVIIMMMVVYVLVFSFGVETGKRYAMEELKAERSKREQMANEFREKMMSQMALTQKSLEEATQGTPKNSVTPKPVTPGGPVTAVPIATATVSPIATTPAAEPAAEATPKKSGKFTIQMSTHTSKATAEREIKRLAERGHQGFIINSGKFLQVCVDAFETKSQATQILQQLKTDGIVPPDAYVRNRA